jgi:hypothetical protein
MWGGRPKVLIAFEGEKKGMVPPRPMPVAMRRGGMWRGENMLLRLRVDDGNLMVLECDIALLEVTGRLWDGDSRGEWRLW